MYQRRHFIVLFPERNRFFSDCFSVFHSNTQPPKSNIEMATGLSRMMLGLFQNSASTLSEFEFELQDRYHVSLYLQSSCCRWIKFSEPIVNATKTNYFWEFPNLSRTAQFLPMSSGNLSKCRIQMTRLKNNTGNVAISYRFMHKVFQLHFLPDFQSKTKTKQRDLLV